MPFMYLHYLRGNVFAAVCVSVCLSVRDPKNNRLDSVGDVIAGMDVVIRYDVVFGSVYTRTARSYPLKI